MTTVEQATAHRFREEDIARAKALVGLESPNRTREHITAATSDAIRNFARGAGDDNPLFVDEPYGSQTRWGGQIAPPMMAAIINTPLLGDDPASALRRPSYRGIHVFVSGGSWEWYRPIHVGDRLYSFTGIESVEEKSSEFAERSILQTRRTVKMNQRGEVVAVARTLAIFTERSTARKKGKYKDIEPTVYSDEDLAEIDGVYAQEVSRGATPRYWEDVTVGEAMPKMAKGPLTETEIIVFHAGGYGFTPYEPTASRLAFKNRQRIPAFYIKNEQGVPDVAQRVHWDSSWAQAIGNPMAYDYAVMRECWLHHYLTDWIGDDGWVVSQHDEIRKFNYLGDTQIITGEVVGKRRQGSRCLVDLELRCTNQRGVINAPATATVMLPSRDHGPALLPTPDDEVQRLATEFFTRHCQALSVDPLSAARS